MADFLVNALGAVAVALFGLAVYNSLGQDAALAYAGVLCIVAAVSIRRAALRKRGGKLD